MQRLAAYTVFLYLQRINIPAPAMLRLCYGNAWQRLHSKLCQTAADERAAAARTHIIP